MTWEELFLALQQIYQNDKEIMKRKVSAVYSADEAVLLDLMVNAQGTTICFVPDYED